MQCPTDGSVLVMSERSGIEIDYCPTCRGVWLDRGELDKIIDRSLTQPPARRRRPARAAYAPPRQRRPVVRRPAHPTSAHEEAQGELAQRALRLSRPPPCSRDRAASTGAGRETGPMEYAEIARAESERGELVLRERARGRRARGPGAARQRRLRDGHRGDHQRAGAGQCRPRPGRVPAARCWSAASASASRCARCSTTRGSSAAPWSRSSRRSSTGCATAPSRTARRCSPTTASTSSSTMSAWPSRRPRTRRTTWSCSTSTTAPATSCTTPTPRSTGPPFLESVRRVRPGRRW